MRQLFNPIEPYATHTIGVSDGHRLYVEECGHKDGIPVVFVHGGPGAGCETWQRRFFDPKVYRIILFDQRGCGRSRPHASVTDNTTWHLVADIEVIREQLDIDSWLVFGGSWGATLALIYAQTHPDRTRHLILRGVFLMTQAELDWFYGGGAGKFWPETWSRFVSLIPEGERHDVIGAYHRRLFSGDLATETKFGRSWSAWENALASIHSSGVTGESQGDYARAFARLENHYFVNGGFLEFDGQILEHMDRIAHIPGIIVQGRYDMICPPTSAWELSRRWPAGELKMVRNAGHALSEPGISAELVRVMDQIAEAAQ